MDGDQKFWLILWAIISITVATITISVQQAYNSYMIKMAGLGYEEVMVIGKQHPVWKKLR